MSMKAVLRSESFPTLLVCVVSLSVDPCMFLKVLGMNEGELVNFVDWIGLKMPRESVRNAPARNIFEFPKRFN